MDNINFTKVFLLTQLVGYACYFDLSNPNLVQVQGFDLLSFKVISFS